LKKTQEAQGVEDEKQASSGQIQNKKAIINLTRYQKNQ